CRARYKIARESGSLVLNRSQWSPRIAQLADHVCQQCAEANRHKRCQSASIIGLSSCGGLWVVRLLLFATSGQQCHGKNTLMSQNRPRGPTWRCSVPDACYWSRMYLPSQFHVGSARKQTDRPNTEAI